MIFFQYHAIVSKTEIIYLNFWGMCFQKLLASIVDIGSKNNRHFDKYSWKFKFFYL